MSNLPFITSCFMLFLFSSQCFAGVTTDNNIVTLPSDISPYVVGAYSVLEFVIGKSPLKGNSLIQLGWHVGKFLYKKIFKKNQGGLL